jgi:diketogulonate reductase-like aldo/keto reductase
MVASKLPILLLLSLCSTSSIAYNLLDRPTLKVRKVNCPQYLLLCFFLYTYSYSTTVQYGTAWKKEKTADLVAKAVKAGFRHIDTACQPRHYNEAGVGDGWVAAARELNLDRTDVWLQTKFSGLTAHDPNNVPYDVNASLEDRVRQSLQKSLENLKTDYLDSWIMHGPEDNWDDHWEVSIT